MPNKPQSVTARAWRDTVCLWAMHPGAARLYAIASAPEAMLLFDEPEPIKPYMAEDTPDGEPLAALRLARAKGSIAILPITGPIGQNRRVDWASVYSEELQGQIAMLTASEQVGAIVLDINSPGGIVYGTPELAQTIHDAQKIKPIYSMVTGMAASAAYWIGSQATKMFVAPSAKVGSIGVWTGHMDLSKSMEEAGVDVTLVSAGEFKVEGNPYEPLSDAAHADMQASVDSAYADFLEAVARGRGTTAENVRENYGKGRMLRADAAKKAGMIDGVATLPQLVATISAGSKGRGPAYASLERMGLGTAADDDKTDDATTEPSADDPEYDPKYDPRLAHPGYRGPKGERIP